MAHIKLKIDFEIPRQTLHKPWPRFFLLGSCFAENQGIKLQKLGFSCEYNPFGIIFNPVSMAAILERVATNSLYQESDFVFYDNQYFCLEHHGSNHYEDLQNAIDKSNFKLKKIQQDIANSDVAIITLGTSIVYHHLNSQKIVANCHKIPGNQFERKQMSLKETSEALEKIIKYVRILNSHVKIIFTVSPVRHLRSGIVENSLSKAILRSAIEPFLTQSNIIYFPAFEIFIDELRDYRFSKNDMMHPNEDAIVYIWQRFVETFFPDETQNAINEIENYLRFKAHKPMWNPQVHSQKVAEKLNQLKSKYPFLNLE